MRKALFLDRDGVINVNHGYVCSPERTEFVDGIFDFCRQARRQGFLLIVVTNQAGIARGYYSEADFLHYMDWMRKHFVTAGAPLDAVYFCPHHPIHGRGDYLRDCDCRKPKPGMLLAAKAAFDLDMTQSVLVGDNESDRQAGLAAGVGQNLVVKTAPDITIGCVAFVPADSVRMYAALNDITAFPLS